MRNALGTGGEWYHSLDGAMTYRIREAERDGLECLGIRSRARFGHDLMRDSRAPWTQQNSSTQVAFDTWCLSCGRRMRVDGRNAGV